MIVVHRDLLFRQTQQLCHGYLLLLTLAPPQSLPYSILSPPLKLLLPKLGPNTGNYARSFWPCKCKNSAPWFLPTSIRVWMLHSQSAQASTAVWLQDTSVSNLGWPPPACLCRYPLEKHLLVIAWCVSLTPYCRTYTWKGACAVTNKHTNIQGLPQLLVDMDQALLSVTSHQHHS